MPNVHDIILGKLILVVTLSATLAKQAVFLQASGYLHLHFELTWEKLDAKFALEQQKAEQKLAIVEVYTLRERKKSLTRIVALKFAAVIPVAPRNKVGENELLS